jgi:hypothetical protein
MTETGTVEPYVAWMELTDTTGVTGDVTVSVEVPVAEVLPLMAGNEAWMSLV